MLVLHLTPLLDCFQLIPNTWLFFRWHLRVFVCETSVITPQELLNTIDIKNPKQTKKIHKTNDGVGHCNSWFIILEIIKHSGIPFGIDQKAGLDWRIPLSCVGVTAVVLFLAYILWFLIVREYPLAGLSLDQKMHLSVLKLWFMLSIFMKTSLLMQLQNLVKPGYFWILLWQLTFAQLATD